jgi:hypothetical protein
MPTGRRKEEYGMSSLTTPMKENALSRESRAKL